MERRSCAERIRVALALRDMKQSDLCKLTGIKKSAMSQYCSGAFVPRQEATYKIAAALRVQIPWLMGFDVPMELDGTAPATALAEEEQKLLSLFRVLDDRGRSAVLATAEALSVACV